MAKRLVIGLAAGLLGGSAAAAAPSGSWVGHLLDQARRENPDIRSAAAYTAPSVGRPLVLVGGSGAPIDAAAPPQAAGVMTDGRSVVEPGTVIETLEDASHDPIGVLKLTFASGSEARHARLAREIRTRLSHHLISANNAADPYPYDRAYKAGRYAQTLVDRAVAKHPEVIILAIHATPPGSTQNVIIGSTIGRIGKKADDDDLRVIEKGETNLEIATSGKRFEAELPLNDAKGRRIGAIGIVTAFKAGDDKETLHARALAIRDELAREIPAAAALDRPGDAAKL